MIFIDDFGQCKLDDEASFDLIANTQIEGISCLVKNLDEERSLKLQHYRDIYKFKIGLHLDLFQIKNFNKKTLSEDIEQQYQKFKNLFNFEPDYIDGHMHCHQFFAYSKTINSVFGSLNIPFRLTDPPFLRELGLLNNLKIAMTKLFLNSFPYKNPLNSKYYPIYLYSNIKNFEKLLEKYLKEMHLKNTVLVLHPSYKKGSWRLRELSSFARRFEIKGLKLGNKTHLGSCKKSDHR